ncbi:T9SS type A sorting domain-containing protein [Emticicia sp. BO119]|uniref:T9SS type A sorting domain-containing protein n=1 Tax=Emticicia sp. BO119 TaxID=2757768 RepID=UPI0015F05F22|nr:T9SS type A sorting domain-containing protein [Emticicia sp. BO119]MBA4849271.1 T9SS type A sorting domain-containing protein [Emticicia sp. BO119]
MRLLGKLFLLLLTYQTALAQVESMPAEPVICYYTEEDSFTELLSDKDRLSNTRVLATSTIQVSYVDFPEAAKTAYEKAMSIWSKYLYSTQPIRIKATWTALSTGVLAVTGSTRIYKNFQNAPFQNVWYPVSLAEAISGKDLNEGDFEIEMKLNSNMNWYYGVDGKSQSGKFDLITVVMHEIAHGLGFSSSMKLVNSNTQGQYGQSGSNYIYDMFLQNVGKIKLTNNGVFGNPSTDLKAALTGNALYFGLRNSQYANFLPKLYAPTSFNEGSSISHFDETYYPQGNPNSLMSPNVRSAEVNQQPGDLLLRCLQDLGWQIVGIEGNPITANEYIVEPVLSAIIFPNPVADIVKVAFPLRNQGRDVSIELLDSKGRTIQRVDSQSITSETIPIDLSSLPDGVYVLKVVDGSQIITKKLVKSP